MLFGRNWQRRFLERDAFSSNAGKDEALSFGCRFRLDDKPCDVATVFGPRAFGYLLSTMSGNDDLSIRRKDDPEKGILLGAKLPGRSFFDGAKGYSEFSIDHLNGGVGLPVGILMPLRYSRQPKPHQLEEHFLECHRPKVALTPAQRQGFSASVILSPPRFTVSALRGRV